MSHGNHRSRTDPFEGAVRFPLRQATNGRDAHAARFDGGPAPCQPRDSNLERDHRREPSVRAFTRLSLVAGAAFAATAAFTAPALAAAAGPNHIDHGYIGAGNAVFVQTDNTAGNQIVAYHRNADGTLTEAGSYATGGAGGVLAGSVVDHLASQGSLTYDARHGLLYAVNAGSDTISVFAVDGDRLALRQTVSSGGSFPVSVAVHGGVVYVLNALDGGSIQGYVVGNGYLTEVAAWNRPLNLDASATPQFTTTPGQIGFSADGTQLLVTTKANSNAVDVFALDRTGAPAHTPVVNSLPGTVPFAFSLEGSDQILLAEVGPNALATFTLHRDGTLTQTASSATGGAATCWITSVGDLVYASNAGSADLSGFRESSRGGLTSVGSTSTDAGTVDTAASSNGRYLYAQTGGAGIVDEFQVNADGSLTAIGSETVPGAVGGEGIAAS
jgi:6-phosphogluconolactonase (cycloisomerase 2 family)